MNLRIILAILALAILLALPVMTTRDVAAKEIKFELLSSEIKDGYLVANVCFETPDANDWVLATNPEDVVLTVNEETIPLYAFQLIEERFSTTAKKSGRCDQLFFPINNLQVSEFSLTFNRLTIPMAEQPDCDKAQEKLDKKNTGIKIKCNHGLGTFNFDIVKKPETATDIQTRKIVVDNFNEVIEGEWTLTGSIK